jgi:uncharacterized membrane protein
VLKRIDVSVVNAAWSILTVFLSILGFLYFKEQWSMEQGIGAVLVLAGMFLLSFFHAHVSLLRTFSMLTVLALAYVPAAFARKYTLAMGEGILPVFFWLVFGRDILGFFIPLVVSPLRRTLRRELSGQSFAFFLLCALAISLFYVSEYTLSLAYRSGPVSLISVVANIQPFMVLFIAWIVWKILPSFAPKELFGMRSLAQKLTSFTIVFIGLVLLGLSQ